METRWEQLMLLLQDVPNDASLLILAMGDSETLVDWWQQITRPGSFYR